MVFLLLGSSPSLLFGILVCLGSHELLGPQKSEHVDRGVPCGIPLQHWGMLGSSTMSGPKNVSFIIVTISLCFLSLLLPHFKKTVADWVLVFLCRQDTKLKLPLPPSGAEALVLRGFFLLLFKGPKKQFSKLHRDPVCLAGGNGRGDREMDLWVLGAESQPCFQGE